MYRESRRILMAVTWVALAFGGCAPRLVTDARSAERSPRRRQIPNEGVSSDGEQIALTICEVPWMSGAAEFDDPLSSESSQRIADYLVPLAVAHPEIIELIGAIAFAGPGEPAPLLRAWARDRGVSRCRYADSYDFLGVPYSALERGAMLTLEGTELSHLGARLGSVDDRSAATAVRTLLGDDATALLVSADPTARFGGLRRLLLAVEPRVPVYVRGGGGTMRIQRGGLALQTVLTRRAHEPMPVTYHATTEGIVVTIGAMFQSEGCDPLTNGNGPSTPAIVWRDRERSRRSFAMCAQEIEETRDRGGAAADLVWVTASDDALIESVVGLWSNLSGSPREGFEVRPSWSAAWWESAGLGG